MSNKALLLKIKKKTSLQKKNVRIQDPDIHPYVKPSDKLPKPSLISRKYFVGIMLMLLHLAMSFQSDVRVESPGYEKLKPVC
jgi:hypothetical protein